MRVRYTLLAAALGLLAAAPAQAQDVVTRQLDEAVTKMREQGFVTVGEAMTGSLAEGANQTLRLTLRAGVSYAIVAFCDEDCSDLDLVLSNGAGDEIDSDLELDDYPVVVYQNAQAGAVSLDVRMATCSVEPCGYGVRVFAQQ